MKKWIAAVAVFALLGGCMKIDKSPPKDLPDYVKLYPGAQPMMTMSVGGLSVEVETSTDKPADVMTYYRTQAASDGLTESASQTPASATAGQEQATFTDGTPNKLLVVLVRPQATGSIVSLSYRPAPKAAS